MLILAGVSLLDSISQDSPNPPDTVFPVITVLGDNPATVELGSTYVDAGATSDGGESIVVSGQVDTNTVGSTRLLTLQVMLQEILLLLQELLMLLILLHLLLLSWVIIQLQ